LNPITENRYNLVRYVVLWGLFAAAWTAVFGVLADLDLRAALAGGAVFGVVSGFEGLILWSILKYGTEGSAPPLLRTMYRTVVGILFTSVAAGSEVIAVWQALETIPAAFAATIPARCLTIAAVYVCFVLWYWSAARSDDRERSEAPAPNTAEKVLEPIGTPQRQETIDRITVRGTGGRIEVIGVEEIVYLQAEGDYVAIVTTAGRWLKEGTMKSFEESLPREKFVRVHRSYIVALKHISRIETSGREHTLSLRGAGGAGSLGGRSARTGGGNHGSTSIRISEAGYRLLKRTLGL
jgi:hypothetical protein